MTKFFLYSIFLSLSLLALADTDGPDYWKVRSVTASDVLNIREKPTWKSDKVGEIPFDGGCIQNLGCVGGLTMAEFAELSETKKQKIRKERPRWCKINYKSMVGWVAGRYLSDDQGSECYAKKGIV